MIAAGVDPLKTGVNKQIFQKQRTQLRQEEEVKKKVTYWLHIVYYTTTETQNILLYQQCVNAFYFSYICMKSGWIYNNWQSRHLLICNV